MQDAPEFDVAALRRHPDGSLDYAYYGGLARRERLLVYGLVFRAVAQGVQQVRARIVGAFMSRDRNRSRSFAAQS